MLSSIFLCTGTQSVSSCLILLASAYSCFAVNVCHDPCTSEYNLEAHTCHQEVTVQQGVQAGCFLGAA